MYSYFGSTNPRPEFRLLCITQNRHLIRSDATRERQVLEATFHVPPEMQRRIWTTTNAALAGAQSIDDSVWHRAKDLLRARSKWHCLPKRDRIKFLASLLPQLATYTLLPSPSA
jgi:hypothetical protein